MRMREDDHYICQCTSTECDKTDDCIYHYGILLSHYRDNILRDPRPVDWFLNRGYISPVKCLKADLRNVLIKLKDGEQNHGE